MAHLNVVLGNFEIAINFYKKAIEKLPPGHGDIETELFLAKSYFKNMEFDKCSKLLKSLSIRYPQDLRVRFDLAVCL